MRDRWLMSFVVFFVLVAAVFLRWEQSDTNDSIPVVSSRQIAEQGTGSVPVRQHLRDRTPLQSALETASRGIRLHLEDLISKRRLTDCTLTIPALRLVDFDKDMLPPGISHSKLESVIKGPKSEISVNTRGKEKKTLQIVDVTLGRDGNSKEKKLVIRVIRYAKLQVEVIFPPNAAEQWSCEVGRCLPVPENAGRRRRDFLEVMKRVPRAYRRVLGRTSRDTSPAVKRSLSGLERRTMFIIDGEGEHFVEVTFDRVLRGVGALVELTRGEETRVVLEPRTIPLVAGILVDERGEGVPDVKILVEGRGPLSGQDMLIPHPREGCGFVKRPGEEEMRYTVTRHAITDKTGRFSIPLTLTKYLNLEAYVKGKGRMAREFELADDHTSITDLTLVLLREERSEGLVRLVPASGEEVDLTKERIKILGVTGQAGSYSPIIGVDEGGWLDTRWLERGRKYRGRFRSGKYRPFTFVCRADTVVNLEHASTPGK